MVTRLVEVKVEVPASLSTECVVPDFEGKTNADLARHALDLKLQAELCKAKHKALSEACR